MFIEMKVAGITMDPFSNTPIVILKDVHGKTALPIWIGVLEASAIATELGEIKPPRPMTHDLLKNIFETLNVEVTKIEVTNLKDNTFFATIHLSLFDKSFTIDSRPSDAIALALRTNAPIYVNEKVIEDSRSISVSKDEKLLDATTNDEQKWQEFLENLSPEDFGKYKM